MDIERSLLSKILMAQEIKPVIEGQIKPELFIVEDNQEVFEWVLDFYEKHGKVPEVKTVRREYPDFKLINVREPLQWYVDQMHDRRKFLRLQRGIIDTDAYLEARDTEGAYEVMAEALRQADELTPSSNGLKLVRAEGVEERTVDWLWKNRISLGAFTIIVGDPGSAKSFLTLGLAALLSKGLPLPDDSTKREPMVSAILNFEDALHETTVPRLRACGADRSKVFLLDIADLHDVDTLAHSMDSWLGNNPDCRFLVIDPIMAVIGNKDTYRGAEVRKALQPWQTLAAKHNVAIVAIMHLRKAEAEKVLYRVSDSGGFVQVARGVLFVGKHEESGRRSISSIKNNLGPMPAPVEFKVEGDPAGIIWVGVAQELNAETLIGANRGRPADAREAAGTWLWEYLGDSPKNATEVKQAALEAGHSKATLDRAVRQAQEEGFLVKVQTNGVWTWQIEGE